MIKLLRFLKPKDWCLLFVSFGFIVFQVWLDLKLPEYMTQITVLIKTSKDMGEIWKIGGYMLACAGGSLATAVFISLISARISAVLAGRMRKGVYNKVESFSMQEIKNFSLSSLITRTTNDIAQVQFALTLSLQLLVKAPTMAIWAICKISSKSWQWSVSTAVAVVIMSVMLLLVLCFAIPRFKKVQKLTDNLNSVTRENLDGIRVVRAYNAEAYQESKFDKANSELTRNHLTTGRLMAVMNPGMTLISNGLSLAIYWLGAYLVSNASTPASQIALLADMGAYMGFAMNIVMSFMLLIMIFMMLPRASVSAKRINEVLDSRLSIEDGKITGVPNLGIVEFKNVSFKYSDAEDYVVKDVSFTASKGETVAFIGSTGSGKSTLINLLPRFYDVSQGQILIDGVDVKDYAQSELHNKIGYVPQRAVLFSGTIRSNLDFGESGKESLTDEDLSQATDIAQASEFISHKEQGIDSLVAQGGTNFSGGQKQRLAIARAIARKPEIFIFDDSFSALDYKTDRVLRSELKSQTKDAITFIVAQRIGTIMDADKIIVLDEGNVVGMGKHKDLLKSCEVYKEIALSQLSKEELLDE